jgi:hypothetical protein
MTIFSKLTADELTALATPINNILTAIASGDGSTASLLGQGIALQGLLVSLAPQVQKIAVTDGAAGLQTWFNAELAKEQAALTGTPVTPAA